MTGSFATIQAAYAVHGVATYPLTADKTPAVKYYNRIGTRYSAELARKFSHAEAGGFCAGARSGLTIIDIDSTDDRLVDEIQDRYGASPVHVLTPSGGRHLHYRHNGERRNTRAHPDVDILGAGNVVAAGSRSANGLYVIDRGTLDDLGHLPRMKEWQERNSSRPRIHRGKRNAELFRHCRTIVDNCDTFEQFLDAVHTWADDRLAEPLSDEEVIKTAASVWRYRGGRKRVMSQIVDGAVLSALATDPAVLGVCAFLLAENGPGAAFMIADGLGRAFGWPRRLVPHARRAMLSLGIVECVRRSRPGQAALYRWKLRGAP